MLLLVDDDADIRESLGEYLMSNGFDVMQAENAEAARAAILAHKFEIIILDIMMPGEDGLSLCRHISSHSKTPIILLSALNEELDRIIGLEIGADDYLTKPFNPRELLARIRAILRRGAEQPDSGNDNDAYHFQGYIFDAARHQLTDPEGKAIALTGNEAKLLQLLLEAENRVLSRDYLLEQISGRQSDAFDRSGYRFALNTKQDGDSR